MDFTVGSILEGKVQSIAKFGAFITLPDGQTGPSAYLRDCGYLRQGYTRFSLRRAERPGQGDRSRRAAPHSLSIKQAQPTRPGPPGAVRAGCKARPVRRPAPMQPHGPPAQRSGELSFEEKLKAFLSESDRKIAGLKQYSDHKTKSRRR